MTKIILVNPVNPRALVTRIYPHPDPVSNWHGNANTQLRVHTTALAYAEIATPGKTERKSQKFLKIRVHHHHVITPSETSSLKTCANSAA